MEMGSVIIGNLLSIRNTIYIICIYLIYLKTCTYILRFTLQEKTGTEWIYYTIK